MSSIWVSAAHRASVIPMIGTIATSVDFRMHPLNHAGGIEAASLRRGFLEDRFAGIPWSSWCRKALIYDCGSATSNELVASAV